MIQRSVSFTAALLTAVLVCSNGAFAQPQEPIAFTGHGVMFDHSGKPIEVTSAFIERAQAYYIELLSARLEPARLAAFHRERTRYSETYKRSSTAADQGSDKQDALIINAALIDWLIREVPTYDGGELQGKNNLMKARLRYRLFAPEVGAPYTAPPKLMDLLARPAFEAKKN